MIYIILFLKVLKKNLRIIYLLLSHKNYYDIPHCKSNIIYSSQNDKYFCLQPPIPTTLIAHDLHNIIGIGTILYYIILVYI